MSKTFWYPKNFIVGFITLIIFGFIYYILSIRNRNKINRNSTQISNLTREQIKCVQESYASKRDLIIYNLRDFYLDIFKVALLKENLLVDLFILVKQI